MSLLDRKISQLPELESITGSEYLIVVANGVSYRTTIEQLALDVGEIEFDQTKLAELLTASPQEILGWLRVIDDSGHGTGIQARALWGQYHFIFEHDSDVHVGEENGTPQIMGEMGRVRSVNPGEGYVYLKNTNANGTDKSLPEPDSEFRLYDQGRLEVGSAENYISLDPVSGKLSIFVSGSLANEVDLTTLGL